MRLDLYVGRRYAVNFLIAFGAFFAVLVALDAIEQGREFETTGIGYGGALGLAALHVPASVYRVSPIVAIIASLWLFRRLARGSELIVARAGGMSGLRILVAPVIAALLIGIAMVTVLNPIVAATKTQYGISTARLGNPTDRALAVGPDGLWLREGTAEGQTVIHAEGSSNDGTRLSGLTVFVFDTARRIIMRITAERAELGDGSWTLYGTKRWDLSGSRNPERSAELDDRLTLDSNLTPKQITEGFGDPDEIAIWDLPAFIDRIEGAGFSALRYRVYLQMEIAKPVLLVAMVLIGAGFAMRHSRFGRTGMMMLLAIISGFALYLLRNFTQILGENGEIPVILAAWVPPVAALLMALGLLLHMEDG